MSIININLFNHGYSATKQFETERLSISLGGGNSYDNKDKMINIDIKIKGNSEIYFTGGQDEYNDLIGLIKDNIIINDKGWNTLEKVAEDFIIRYVFDKYKEIITIESFFGIISDSYEEGIRKGRNLMRKDFKKLMIPEYG